MRLARSVTALALMLLGSLPSCATDESIDPVDAGAAVDPPVESCPVPTLVELYPDDWPPEPYGPKPAATACVATEHDVIVVLGCPNEDDGQPSACQIARADIAVAFMDAGYGRRFITTGGAVHNAFVEAETLAALLVERGVPETDVLLEPQAEHTDENIYYASQIMKEQGLRSALVVSDDRGHLLLTALCDSNCCVDVGRLTVFEFPVGDGEPVLAGHYALYPHTPEVSAAECAQISIPTKFMCVNLADRRACASDFQL